MTENEGEDTCNSYVNVGSTFKIVHAFLTYAHIILTQFVWLQEGFWTRPANHTAF